jgi:tetratricopeptide (TPR) repeat protein
MNASDPTDVARHYCVDDIDGSTVPATRLRNILDAVAAGKAPTKLGLKYLEQQGLAALHSFSSGQTTYEVFRAAALIEQRDRIARAEAERIASEASAKAREDAWAADMDRRRVQAERERQARERDPRHIAKVKSQKLRAQYGLDQFIEEQFFGRLMDILRRVDDGVRIPPEDAVWLTTEGRSHFTRELEAAYHALEAEFFIGEYKRTKDPWSAVSASSHLRKCDQSSQAHGILSSIPQDRQKLPKLRSAICTTHGGALRDMGQLPDALALGQQAHALTPRDFRPCTLLGAVHMEMQDYETAKSWYEKAVERGATERSIDSELRSIFMRADKEKRAQIRQFLLQEDPQRYAWVRKL